MKKIPLIIGFGFITFFGFTFCINSPQTNKYDNKIYNEMIFSAIANIDTCKKDNNQKLQEESIKQTIDYFETAINELDLMLNDKIPLNFKRAVFVTENAYYDGRLNWYEFNNEIERIKSILVKMIVSRNLNHFKTAGNWAVFTYMTDSIVENNFEPYQYDFENFMSETDFESMMVSRLLNTKKGNCHSLPYLYKILANEVNVESFLATAPMHLYIRHRDEQDKWWNLEMTTGSFSRTSFIIETFNVTDAALESGLFMKALTDKESVALCILDLLSYYEKKTGVYSNNFIRECYTIGLKHYPISMLQVWRANDIKYQLDSKMKEKGFNDYKQILPHQELVELFQIMDSSYQYINKLGFSTLTSEQYNFRVNEIKEQKK